MPKTYRKKPVVIEAGLVKPENILRVAEWCGGDPMGTEVEWTHININTLEGTMRADIGDYVIKGVKGEFYPCKPDIFEATYDLVPVEHSPTDDKSADSEETSSASRRGAVCCEGSDGSSSVRPKG